MASALDKRVCDCAIKDDCTASSTEPVALDSVLYCVLGNVAVEGVSSALLFLSDVLAAIFSFVDCRETFGASDCKRAADEGRRDEAVNKSDLIAGDVLVGIDAFISPIEGTEASGSVKLPDVSETATLLKPVISRTDVLVFWSFAPV